MTMTMAKGYGEENEIKKEDCYSYLVTKHVKSHFRKRFDPEL